MKTNKSTWRGYRYDQLATRRLITQVKIELEKERLIGAVSPKMMREMSVVNRVASLAQSAYSIVAPIRKIIAIVKSFSASDKTHSK